MQTNMIGHRADLDAVMIAVEMVRKRLLVMGDLVAAHHSRTTATISPPIPAYAMPIDATSKWNESISSAIAWSRLAGMTMSASFIPAIYLNTGGQ